MCKISRCGVECRYMVVMVHDEDSLIKRPQSSKVQRAKTLKMHFTLIYTCTHVISYAHKSSFEGFIIFVKM